MTTTIGSLAVVLTANAAPFVKGLRTAAGYAVSTASSIGKTLASVGKSTATFAGVGGLLSGGGLVAGVLSGLSRLEKLDIEARQLGVTVKDLDTLMLAAGPAAQAMSAGIGSLTMKIAEANAGSLDARRSFDRLVELSGGGGFASGTFTDQFAQIAERLSRIPNEATRAAVAFDLLGDKAGELLPLLSRGGAGIGEAADKMRRFGLGAGSGDLQSVRELMQAQRDLKSVGTGFLNQITLGLAPVAAEVLKTFDGWKINLSGLKNTVVDVAETIAKMGAFVVAAWKDTSLIRAGWDALFAYLKAGVLALGAEINAAVAGMLQSIGKQMQDPQVAGLGKLIKEFGTATGNPIIGSMGKLLDGMAGGNLVDGFGNKLAQSAEATRKAAGLALDDAGKKYDALATKFRGTDSFKAVDAMFARARGHMQDVAKVGQQHNPISFWQQSLAQFQQQMGSLRNPMETFGEGMRQLQQFQQLGLFAGQGGGMRERMAADLFGKLNSSVQMPQMLSAGAAMQNTKEAYSAALQYSRGDQRLTIAEQTRALMQEGNRQNQEQIRIGAEVLAELRKGGFIRVKGV